MYILFTNINVCENKKAYETYIMLHLNITNPHD